MIYRFQGEHFWKIVAKKSAQSFIYSKDKHINPFFPSAPFPYTQKTSENRKAFWSFHGVEKGCIETEWVKWIFQFTSWYKLRFIKYWSLLL